MENPGLKLIDDLVSRAVSGDGTAFTALWDRHINSLKSYLAAEMKIYDSFILDDVCSRTFEKAFRQIVVYDHTKSCFITWLCTIARNTAIDVLDQESRYKGLSVRLDSDTTVEKEVNNIGDDGDSPLDCIIRDEDMEQTLKCIEGLPDLYREIARKRLVDGLHYAEIAEETGLELNTVRTRIRRAKALMEKMADGKV